MPVAAVEARDGETPALCVGLVEATDPNHRSWTEVRRFVHTAAGRWRESRRQWVNGEAAQPSMGPGRSPCTPRIGCRSCGVPSRASRRAAGSTTLAGTGRPPIGPGRSSSSRCRPLSAKPAPAGSRAAISSPTGSSASAPGACWFRDDIAYAVRVHDDKPEHNDVVKLGFYGSGALPEPMSDFNDVAFIHRVGLSHSLRASWPQTEAATPNLPGPVPAK